MSKSIVMSASTYIKKFYFNNEEYNHLPQKIQSEIKLLVINAAEKMNGVFSVGFKEDGEIFLELSTRDDQLSKPCDIEIDHVKNQHKQLFKSLLIWYKLYKTKEGYDIRNNFANQISK